MLIEKAGKSHKGFETSILIYRIHNRNVNSVPMRLEVTMRAPLPANEPERLRALADYDVLDSIPEPNFDRLTRLAAHLLQTPIALVSLVDENRQWFKSTFGLDVLETTRDWAFCAHAILLTEPLVVCNPEDDHIIRERS